MKFQIDDACWLGDDGWFHRGTIRTANGRIAKLESDFAADAPCGDEIVVPGLVDHVALDDAIYQALRIQHAYQQLSQLKEAA